MGSLNTVKTNLIERVKYYNNFYQYKISSRNIKHTIAPDFESITVKINNKIITILFWVSLGYEISCNFFSGRYHASCKVFLISYDAINRNSFNNMIKLYEDIKSRTNKAKFILIRNKYDLEINELSNIKDYVSEEEALEFADKNNTEFVHTSSLEKYGNGIKELFTLILNHILINEENKE